MPGVHISSSAFPAIALGFTIFGCLLFVCLCVCVGGGGLFVCWGRGGGVRIEGSQPECCISSMVYVEKHHSGRKPSVCDRRGGFLFVCLFVCLFVFVLFCIFVLFCFLFCFVFNPTPEVVNPYSWMGSKSM